MSAQDHSNPETNRPMRQLVLLLITAAVSFALGLIIGRSLAPVQPIIKVSMPVVESQTAESQNYNFYKALPKGETTALGSGINNRSSLSTTTASPPTTVSQPETVKPAVAERSSAPASVPASTSSKVDNQENWILQASSSPQEKDAQSLSKRLRSKGYKTAVSPVAIKGKTWFRVYVGPYSSAAEAKEAAAKLSRQEKLAPIARKI